MSSQAVGEEHEAEDQERTFFFSSRRRHTRFDCDWSSDVCSSDLVRMNVGEHDDGVADPYLGMADLPSRRLVPEQLDGAERLRVEVERALGAVDDQVEIGRASCRERV